MKVPFMLPNNNGKEGDYVSSEHMELHWEQNSMVFILMQSEVDDKPILSMYDHERIDVVYNE